MALMPSCTIAKGGKEINAVHAMLFREHHCIVVVADETLKAEVKILALM